MFRRAYDFLVSALLIGFLLFPSVAHASIAGSISGIVTDPTGAAVPNAEVVVIEVSTNISQHARTNGLGAYSFLALAVGRYRLQVTVTGFETYEETGIVLNANDALRIDVTLKLGQVTERVEVTTSAAHVDTTSTQLGDVIGSTTMESLPLNGRTFTNLLGLQPGVIPVESGTMYWFLPGSTQAGNLSISGQRESDNGFQVNGGNVEETRNMGAAVVPNLDSIAEFRLITSDFDAEYGHYSGGMINVVTKSGTNQWHGDVFEFLRNEKLDARNFYEYNSVNPVTNQEIPGSAISEFRQNQFGGTLGGPIVHDRVFFFADYQGTRQLEALPTGLIPVPSAQERVGNFSQDDLPNIFNGNINGTYFANLLSQRLGYAVTANEPYWTQGCTTPAQCIFPSGIIPTNAWSPAATKLLQFIPTATVGPFFESSQNIQNTSADQGGLRLDGNSRWGMLSAYYAISDSSTLVPFGPNNIPGFPMLSSDRTQQLMLSDTLSGPSTVNEFHFNLLRIADHFEGAANSSEWGVNLSDYGFNTTGPGGWVVNDQKYSGIPSIGFPDYSMGAPEFFYNRYETIPQVQDNFSKLKGPHTIKFGGDFNYTNFVEASPVAGGNGWFSFSGSETGNAFTDFLIGAMNPLSTQSSLDTDERKSYVGLYGQDSWRARKDLTVNYGLRWELIQPWYERFNQRTNFVEGVQSTVFPNAPEGIVFAGDNVPGFGTIPRGSGRTPRNNFAPRLGIAYSPSGSGGLMEKILGGPGKTSIRGSWGIFYQTIEGLDVFNVDPEPPFIESYTSAVPPLLESPLIARATGEVHPPIYPFVAAVDGRKNYDWSNNLPFGGIPGISINNRTPYTESYHFTLQRQIKNNDLFTLAYVGSQAHALMTNQMTNPGNQKLCLSLSQPSEVAPGTPTCGPYGEGGVYTEPNGTIINGTRAPFGPNFGDDAWATTIANSNYNSLQVSLRHTTGRLSFLAGYTYSKSLDNASSINDNAINPLNQELSKSLSGFDIAHNFVISYNYLLPFDRLTGNRGSRLAGGWRLSGVTHFATGFPVPISEGDDRSFLGSSGAGVGKTVDEPNYTPGNLAFTNPRTGLPYFNTALFSLEPLGSLGTSNRQFFHGPGLNDFDTALLKDLKLNERLALQFRGEFFNIFNHAQFMTPVGNINSGAFGLVTGARDPRIGQVALKLLF